MTALVDSSVMVDYLRGDAGAGRTLEAHRAHGRLHASEITRLEVLAGMRPREEMPTRELLATLTWHSVDEQVSELAGELGRQWPRSHHTIDGADLAIAATAMLTGCDLLTRNIRHFPMFQGLRAPY